MRMDLSVRTNNCLEPGGTRVAGRTYVLKIGLAGFQFGDSDYDDDDRTAVLADRRTSNLPLQRTVGRHTKPIEHDWGAFLSHISPHLTASQLTSKRSGFAVDPCSTSATTGRYPV